MKHETGNSIGSYVEYFVQSPALDILRSEMGVWVTVNHVWNL